ncbi:hypothetical protein AVEN_34211-1 [Araneus ventricosus]|uniref:Uncharacterized protein n=1 Tax=Araneus ventricosus TaxID=182803 RepID=A0A4Y2S7F8_ARAVE|nr:hypothetical protein AVEN_34211-1 [Araneus ventricosus]
MPQSITTVRQWFRKTDMNSKISPGHRKIYILYDPPRSVATSNFFLTPWVTEQSRCLSGKSSLPTTDISLKRRQREPGVQAVTSGLLVSGSD